jgi:addiction module HigA family antidote
MQKKSGLPPIHPGEIIKEDILPSAGLSVTAAAKALGVSRQMLHDILAGRKPYRRSCVLRWPACLVARRTCGCACRQPTT